jgi:hypothetical protein
MEKFDGKIVTYEIVKEGEVICYKEPEVPKLDRPESLHGTTYKLSPVNWSSSLYVTINDYVDIDGKAKPFELFVSTKQSEHYQWMIALSLIVTALFRRRTDMSLILEELESVVDPNDVYFVKDKGMVKSVVAHIGLVLREHCQARNLL